MPSVQELTNPQKDGFLTKFGGRGLKSNWSKRWFVLKDGYLYYFKHNTDPKELKAISLKKYNKISEGGKGKKYSFKIETGADKERVFYIYAENQDVMKAWFDIITIAINDAAKSTEPVLAGSPSTESVTASPTTSPPTSPATSPRPEESPVVPAQTLEVTTTTKTPSSSSSLKLGGKGKICTLYVNVAEARNLPPCDLLSGKCDPYVIVDSANCQTRTQTIFKSLNPFFGEEVYLDIADTYAADAKANVKITVWDDDRFIKDTLIGQIVVPIASLRDGKLKEQWYPIFPADYEVYVSGDLHLKLFHDTAQKQVKVKVVAGRNLASKDANGLSDPYVQISYNKKKQKTKVIKKTLNPTFDEDFTIDIPEKYYETQKEKENTENVKEDDGLISISCWDWDALGSNEFMGEVLVHLQEIEANTDVDMWYILMPKGNQSEAESDEAKSEGENAPKSTGELRLKLKYTEDQALPVGDYDPIYEVLLGEKGPQVALLLEQIVGPAERGELATALVRACEAKASAFPLLSTLAKDEINQTQHAETIFRGNSLATKGIDAYMKLNALPYLQEVIGPTIKNIFEYKKACEVDPTREKEENIPENFKRLVKFANQLTTSIFASADKCPKGLRDLFKELQTTVTDKWGPDSVARFSAVSSFLFLRHICPALLNPKLFELAPEHADQKTARVLTLLSKTIQNLANLVEFGQKEPYMLKMNEFILENMPKMKEFLNEIAKPEGTTSDDATKSEELVVKRSAALFRYFDKSLPALKPLESTHADPQLVGSVIAAVEKVQAKASS